MNIIRRFVCGTMVLAALCVAVPARSEEDLALENHLLRLAEILGSLHYLRNLCGETGTEWRDRMQALLEAENPNDARRKYFIASFNRGYRSFETTYTTCTPSALEAIRRYMKEGETLTRDTASRYGN